MRSRKIILICTYLINDPQIIGVAYQRSTHQNHLKKLFFLEINIDYSDLSSTSSDRKKKPTNLCKLKLFSWNPSKPKTKHFSGASCSFMSISFSFFSQLVPSI